MVNRRKPKTRRPDYFLYVDAVARGQRIPRIPCKIYLDLEAPHRSRVVLRPDRETGERLIAVGSWSLIGYLPRDESDHRSYLRVPRFLVDKASTTDWGPGLSETRVYGHASSIIVSTALRGATAARAHAVAYLHGGTLVSPRGIFERSFTGSAAFRRTWRCRVRADRRTLVVFDRHVVFPKSGPKEGVAQLVLTTRLPAPLSGPLITLSRHRRTLEDALTLVSIAGRARASWHRLQASDGRVLVHYLDTQKRRPSAKVGPLGPLIERNEVRDFLEWATPRLKGSAAREEIIGASYALAPFHELPLESSYLAMFAKLEFLVIRLIGGPDQARILKRSRWDRLSGDIKRIIGAWSDASGALIQDEQEAMYEKLGELNRVPFARMWAQCVGSRRIPVHDLWPMVAADQQIGLLGLRHRLAHGEMVPEVAAQGLLHALRHLRWTLERVGLSALDFDLNRSDASPAMLEARSLESAANLAQRRLALTRAWPD